MDAKETLDNDNSILIYNDYVHYEGRDGGARDLVNLGEMFLKLFGNSDSVRVISKILDVEVVAVTKQPYGKHSTFFKEHNTHRFDILIVSLALGKIQDARLSFSLNTLSNGSVVAEIPVYIGDECMACIIVGPFYMSEEAAGDSPDGRIPFIKTDKVRQIGREICEIGDKILADCFKYQRHNRPQDHYIDEDAELLFNCGNFFIFDILTDTYIISRGVCDIFGYEYGRRYTYSDFIASLTDNFKQAVVQFCKKNVLLGSKDYKMDVDITRAADGQVRSLSISGTIIKDEDGLSVRTVGSVLDATELKKAQAKLEQEVASKNRFIKIIGHDLKNPFNGVIGFSELLNANLQQHNYEEAAEYAEIIKQAASEGYELLVNLLDYSTSQAGDMTVLNKEFDLFRTVDSILKLSSAQAMRKGITLDNRIAEPTMIYSDENKISTILRNLISNAIKFCYQDGIVMIKADIDGGSVRIAISDTGQSISTARLHSINHAADVSSTDGTAYENGTSIGLKLCHSYLKALGSRLEADCDDGVTTFKFTI